MAVCRTAIINAMGITREDVLHVAQLARLQLEDHEIEAYHQELNELLGHFEDLNAVDVTGFEPKPHAVALTNAWDEDVVQNGLHRDQALANAPKQKAGLFLVPTILED